MLRSARGVNSYKKLCKAYNYLASNEGCRLILTSVRILRLHFYAVSDPVDPHTSNADSDVMLPDGKGVVPGEGAIVAPLLHSRKGLEPVVVGKPEQILLEAIKEKCASLCRSRARLLAQVVLVHRKGRASIRREPS